MKHDASNAPAQVHNIYEDFSFEIDLDDNEEEVDGDDDSYMQDEETKHQ